MKASEFKEMMIDGKLLDGRHKLLASIILILHHIRTAVFVTGNFKTDGYLQLRKPILYKLLKKEIGEVDSGEENEYIDAVHTHNETVSVSCDGDTESVPIREISSETLIEVLEELEYFTEIVHQKEIEIL